MICESCGMPMVRLEDHGGGRLDVHFCKYCTDPLGRLKPKEEVRKTMVDLAVTAQRRSIEDAEKFVDRYMKKMPAWRK